MLKKSKLNNSHGFSLVEVMIVAAIMAGISYFAMELLDGQRKSQRDIENRFELLEMITEISSTLKNNANCLETFKDQDVRNILKSSNRRDSKTSSDQLDLEGIKKVRSGQVVLTHSFAKNKSSWKVPVAVELKLRDYELTNSNLEKINQWDGQLSLSYSWDKKSKRVVTKSINLSFTFDESAKLISCHGGSGAGGILVIADPSKDTSLVGKTGYIACQDQGKTCVAVHSQNFASRVYGQEGLDNLCQSNYDNSLSAVVAGVNKSNWHSCEVQLGTFDTYSIKRSGLELQCQAIFSALCQ